MIWYKIDKKNKVTQAIVKVRRYPNRKFTAKAVCGKNDVYSEETGKRIACLRVSKDIEYQRINDLKREIHAFAAAKQAQIDKSRRRIQTYNIELQCFKG